MLYRQERCAPVFFHEKPWDQSGFGLNILFIPQRMDNQKNKKHVFPCGTQAESGLLFSFEPVTLKSFSVHDNGHEDDMTVLGVLFFNGKDFFLSKETSDTGGEQYAFYELPCREKEFSCISIPVIFEGLPSIGEYMGNVRFVNHRDGWIYMCYSISTDFHFPKDGVPRGVRKGVLRSRDVFSWEALPEITTEFDDHDDMIIHPDFIDNGYGLFTMPLIARDSARKGCCVAFGTSYTVNPICIDSELVFNEFKTDVIVGNYSFGPPPLRTALGWLQMIQYFVETDQHTKLVCEVFIADPHLVFKIIFKPKKCLIELTGINQNIDLPVIPSCIAWKITPEGELVVYMINVFGGLEVSRTLFSDIVV